MRDSIKQIFRRTTHQVVIIIGQSASEGYSFYATRLFMVYSHGVADGELGCMLPRCHFDHTTENIKIDASQETHLPVFCTLVHFILAPKRLQNTIMLMVEHPRLTQIEGILYTGTDFFLKIGLPFNIILKSNLLLLCRLVYVFYHFSF